MVRHQSGFRKSIRLPSGFAYYAVILVIACNGGCVSLHVSAKRSGNSDRLSEFVVDGDVTNVAYCQSTPTVNATPVEPVAYENGRLKDPSTADPSKSQLYSIAEVIAKARIDHPLVIASAREIEQAKADVRVASNKQNPEFVLDIDTPLHDENGATQLSTRVTFPIGQSRWRQTRIRVARREVATAMAAHQAELRRQSENALLSALQLVYLQEKVTIDEQADQMARERLQLLSPELRDGDSANNLVDYVNAGNDAQQARRKLFIGRRELAVAQVSLADAMGINLADEVESGISIVVIDSLRNTSLDLPSLQVVIAAALIDSAELVTAQSATQRAWLEQQLARIEPLSAEIGPLYQDRLGRDDDAIGFRFQTDLPVHAARRNNVISAGVRAQASEDLVRWKRQRIANSTARDYQELKSLAEQLRQDRSDPFLENQEKLLFDIEAQEVMTGEQTIRIRQLILDHQRNQLNLEYRFAMLRSKLRLHVPAQDSY